MAFQSVYRTLQELFPQVDTRLLKAAAIEHAKDPDGAVEFIISEVIPRTVEEPANRTLVSSVESEEKATDQRAQDPWEFYDAKDFNDQLSRSPMGLELEMSKTRESAPSITGDIDNLDCSQEPENHSAGESSEFEKYRDLDLQTLTVSPSSTENHSAGETSEFEKYRDLDLQTLTVSPSSTAALIKDPFPDVSLNKSTDSSVSDCEPLSVNSNVTVHSEGQKNQSDLDINSLYGSNYVELASLSVKDHTLKSMNCSVQSNAESLVSNPKLGISELSIDDNAFTEDIQGLDNANSEESSGPHSTVAQSAQFCNTDLLESIVEESKSHKKKLLSDMELVLKLMKEVEFQENAAEQAKNEAGAAGVLEIHAKVDELKDMLKRAREANDMHSGEVYGERAILVTEMKELQCRLLALSDLKEESVSILDVMRQTLEERLAAAEMVKIAAEKEKHESEALARKALAEQEHIMEKVVEDSMILRQESEENARLREFLMNRGRVVDTLQGEISVICQDVKLLKEKLDNRVPLSQSISSEQTSCILASSGSARKITESEPQLLKHDKPLALPTEPLPLPPTVKTVEYARDDLLDEGWELFEDATDN